MNLHVSNFFTIGHVMKKIVDIYLFEVHGNFYNANNLKIARNKNDQNAQKFKCIIPKNR